MHTQDSQDLVTYRENASAWLAANAPAHELPRGKIDDAEEVRCGRAWQRALYDGGYAGILLPRAVGGQAGTIPQAVIFAEEEQRYNVPRGAYRGIGLGMALPVILKHGTPEQVARFVEATLKGELVWCQLFSEPSAGSDLAALRTKGVRDGDDWIVNGQKVWSSWAHQSDWGILIVRTDPIVPKHKGLTFFLLDMRTPGIDIRPIRQISGASDFNETFLTDVRVVDSCRVGAAGEGWACTMTTLMGERLNQGGADHGAGVAGLIDHAARTRRGAGTALDSSAVRLALAQSLAEEMAEVSLQARLRAMVMRGEDPGATSAIVKLASATRLQKTSGLAIEMRAMAGIAHGPDDSDQLWDDYIYSTALRVAGGADEVLRNQLAERVLGMPGEIRTDKNMPFDQR